MTGSSSRPAFVSGQLGWRGMFERCSWLRVVYASLSKPATCIVSQSCEEHHCSFNGITWNWLFGCVASYTTINSLHLPEFSSTTFQFHLGGLFISLIRFLPQLLFVFLQGQISGLLIFLSPSRGLLWCVRKVTGFCFFYLLILNSTTLLDFFHWFQESANF